MRDIKRIKPLIKKLEKIWLKNPELRLGQLILNGFNGTEKSIYWIEDTELISYLTGIYKDI